MLGLIIDTSTKYLYLALVKDGIVLDTYIKEGAKNHSGQSVFNIEAVLNKHGYQASDLTGVYCGYGPGSYTGVRISVTIAKMLASMLETVDLYYVSSLYLISSSYNNKNVAVMMDARRGNVFSALYGNNSLEDKLRTKDEFVNEVSKLDDVIFVDEENISVDPLKVISHSTKVEKDLVDAFVPNYLRIPEAEYNLEHKND